MSFAYNPVILPLVIAAGIAGYIAFYTWRRRAIAGALPLALLSGAISWWQIAYALEIAGEDLSTKLFWGRLQYISIVSIPLLLLLFALYYTNRTRYINTRGHLLSAAIPFVTAVLVLTSDFNTLVWRTVTIEGNGYFTALRPTYGPWFWIHWAYSYILLVSATLMIVRLVTIGQKLHRRQAAVMLAGIIAPWIGNAVYVSGIGPLHNLDLTPFGFTVTVVAISWSIFGFRLIDLQPIARDLVVDELLDCMLVIDAQNQVADINPAAARMLGKPSSKLLGLPVGNVLGEWTPALERFRDTLDCTEEIRLEGGAGYQGEPRWFDLRIFPLYDPRRLVIGRVVTLREISARKRSEARLRQLSMAVESTPVSVVITDLTGAILYANPKFMQTTGYSLEDVRGLNPRILKTEHTPAYIHRQLWETITSGREWHGEFCNRKKNGELYWEHASISPVPGDDGRTAWYVAVKEDITEQRRMREQLRQQNAYLSFMHQMTLELLDRRRIEDLLEGVVEGASALLDAPYGALYLSDGHRLTLRACTELMNPLAGGVFDRDSAASMWQVFDSGMPVAGETAATVIIPDERQPMEAIKTAAEFPVMAGRRCLGVLGLGRSDAGRPFTPDEVQIGMLFTRLAALVLDNAELYDAAVKEIAEHKLTQALLQQSEARYRQIVENASDLIYVLDAERRFSYVSPAALNALDMAHAAVLLGRPFSDIVAPEQRAQVDEAYDRQARQRDPAGYFEFPALGRDGEQIWLGQNTHLLEERSEIVGFQCIARDITSARKAQEVLRLARDQAEEASHFKTQMLSRVSHELRTPLGALIGFAELLQAGIYGPLSGEQAQTVEKIRVSSEYLTAMINDLLDGAQLEARRMTLRLDRVSLRAVLDHIEERMAVLAANKGLALRTSMAPELPRRVIGDRQRLEQILTNLVGNAIKYTDQGEVRVHLFLADKNRWGILVSDTGIGISGNDLAHIFEPFYQALLEDGQRRRGTGLGLAITSQLVDLMGGKITVESQPGCGSAFTVLLPMERAVSDTAGLEG